MSIFTLFSSLFSSAEALEREVDEVAPRSSRAGRAQKCSVCRLEGHKAPSHKSGTVHRLQERVTDLQQQLEEARRQVAEERSGRQEMTAIARAQRDRADVAEGQVRALWDRMDEMAQQLAGIQQRLADAEAAAAPYVNGDGTRI